jgi:hypothetical protein
VSTLADNLRQAYGGNVWSIFGSQSLHPAASVLPAPIQHFDTALLDQRIGVPLPAAVYAPPEPVAPPINWPLRIGLGLGAFAVIGFLVHLRRRS